MRRGAPTHGPSSPSREAGYTLIEIMAVIAIIGVLMSILIYGVAGIRRNALASGSKALIESVRGAIDAYYSTYKCYPPDGYDVPVFRQTGASRKPIKGAQCLVYYLAFTTAQEVEVGEEKRVKENAPFLVNMSADMFSGDGDLDERLANPDVTLVDRFSNELHYDSVAKDPRTGNYLVNEQTASIYEEGSNVTALDPRRAGGGGAIIPRHKGAYDLWSNGIKASDPTDDLGNWK